MAKHKEETCTSKILRALRCADDFLRPRDIAARTGCTSNQVSTTLHHLAQHHAVEFLSDAAGTWWMATTQDDRFRIIEERTPESRPRKARRKP